MTEDEVGRILAVYYGLVSALELLNNYCEKLLIEHKKEFHSKNHEENKHFNNMMAAMHRSKYCYEQYQKQNYKLDCKMVDDKGNVIENPNEYQVADENLKTGIGYIRFLFFLFNVCANADDMKNTLTKFESTLKLFIKKWFIPEEAINNFKHYI